LTHPLSHYVEYAFVRTCGALLRALPHPAALRVGGALGFFAYRVAGVRKRVAERNIRAALGLGQDVREVRRIAGKAYVNLGFSLAELLRLRRMAAAGFDRWVSFEGLEHLDRALSRGKGAVLATGHFGSWELMGAALAQKGYPMNFLVGHQSNRLIDRELNELRAALGIGLVRHGAHVRQVFRLLEGNKFVAMLCDHDAGRRGLTVSFFGMPASAAVGPAAFALMSGAPLMMGFIYRRAGGGHRVEITPPLKLERDLEPSEALAAATQELALEIERRIRAAPDHWFWLHRRWKPWRSGRSAVALRKAYLRHYVGPSPALRTAAGGSARQPAGKALA